MLACEHGAVECGAQGIIGIIIQVWHQTSWVPPLPLIDGETLSQVLNFCFFSHKMGIIVVSIEQSDREGSLDDQHTYSVVSVP